MSNKADINVRVQAVINAPTEGFVGLLKKAELDPKKDLAGGDWSGVDFADADVSGWNLRAARLSGSDLSRVTNITKAHFDLENEFKGTKLPEGITVKLLVPKAKTGGEWAEERGIVITIPSGWENAGIPFESEITQRDFFDLLMKSRREQA